MCILSHYAFGDWHIDYYEMNAGNILRKVLEGYSSYKMKVTKRFNNKQILDLIEKKDDNTTKIRCIDYYSMERVSPLRSS